MIILILFNSIFIVLILGAIIYNYNKNRYVCKEDGCKMKAFGNFKTKEICESECKNVLQNSLKQKRYQYFKQKHNKDNQEKYEKEHYQYLKQKHNKDIYNQEKYEKEQKNIVLDINIMDNEINVDEINVDLNYKNIEDQIIRKKSFYPYYATTKESRSVITDYDVFPYPRYFRGIAQSNQPIVAEREAGWRPRHDNAYISSVNLELSPDCVIGSLESRIEKLYNCDKSFSNK